MKLPVIIALIVIALIYAGTYIADWHLERNAPAPVIPHVEQTYDEAKRMIVERATVLQMTLSPVDVKAEAP